MHISANVAWLSQRQRAAVMTSLTRATHLHNFCLKCDATAEGQQGFEAPDYSAWEMQLPAIGKNNSNLKEMKLAVKNILDVPLPQFVSMVKASPKLTHFTFDQVEAVKDVDTSLWDGDFQGQSVTWGDLLQAPHLTHVRISECGLNDQDAMDIGQQLRAANVTHLDLSHNDFGQEGIEAIAEGLKESKVADLNLHRALTSGDISWARLVEALPEANVNNLRLRGWSSTSDEAVEADSMVKQDEAVSLAEGQRGEGAKLTRLDLSRNHELGDGAASAFATTMYSSSCVLAHLNLSITQMTAAGAKDLAQTLQSKVALRELDVSGNPALGDAAAIAFADAMSSPNFALTHLNLSNTGMTNAGAEKLLEALERPGCTLTHLNIEDNGISPELKKKIYNALGIDREKMTDVLGEELMESKDNEFWRSGLNVSPQWFQEG